MIAKAITEMESDFEFQKATLGDRSALQFRKLIRLATELLKDKSQRRLSGSAKKRRAHQQHTQLQPPQQDNTVSFSGILSQQMAACSLKDSGEKQLAAEQQQNSISRPRFIIPDSSASVKNSASSSSSHAVTTTTSTLSAKPKRGPASSSFNSLSASGSQTPKELKVAPITHWFKVQEKLSSSSSSSQSPLTLNNSKKRNIICVHEDSPASNKRARLQKQRSVEIIGEFPVTSQAKRNLILSLLPDSVDKTIFNLVSDSDNEAEAQPGSPVKSDSECEPIMILNRSENKPGINLSGAPAAKLTSSAGQRAIIDISQSPQKNLPPNQMSSDNGGDDEDDRIRCLERTKKKLTFAVTMDDIVFPEPGSEVRHTETSKKRKVASEHFSPPSQSQNSQGKTLETMWTTSDVDSSQVS